MLKWAPLNGLYTPGFNCDRLSPVYVCLIYSWLLSMLYDPCWTTITWMGLLSNLYTLSHKWQSLQNLRLMGQPSSIEECGQLKIPLQHLFGARSDVRCFCSFLTQLASNYVTPRIEYAPTKLDTMKSILMGSRRGKHYGRRPRGWSMK